MLVRQQAEELLLAYVAVPVGVRLTKHQLRFSQTLRVSVGALAHCPRRGEHLRESVSACACRFQNLSVEWVHGVWQNECVERVRGVCAGMV
jgi:hypothetical protein